MPRQDTHPGGPRPSRVAVLIGMYRSGLGAMARGLQVLGVEFGDRLSAPPPHSPTAFGEDLDLRALNDRLTSILGCSWQSPTPIDRRIWESTSLDSLVREATELIQSRFGGCRLWGFHDPRTARLLPFWKQVFGQLEIDPCFIINVRHPMSVMRSMRYRDGFRPERSWLLWLEHLLASVHETRGLPRVVSDYDRLVDSPEQELRRIAAHLDFPISAAQETALAGYANDFIDKGLRHTVYSGRDLASTAGLAALAGRAWTLLLETAGEESMLGGEALASEWARLHEQREPWYPLLTYLDACEEALRPATSQRFSFLEQGLRERDDEIARLSRRLHERDGETDRQTGLLQEKDGQIHRLAGDAATAREGLKQADCALQQARGQNQALQEQLQWSIGLLNRERYSVVRPMARKVYRSSSRLLARLPATLQRRIRKRGRQFLGRGMTLEIPVPVLAPGSATTSETTLDAVTSEQSPAPTDTSPAEGAPAVVRSGSEPPASTDTSPETPGSTDRSMADAPTTTGHPGFAPGSKAPMPDEIAFRCNICNTGNLVAMAELEREVSSCKHCLSSVRTRSIIHALSMELFGNSLSLADFPHRADIKGAGLSDWEVYAKPLAKRFSYTNTHFHKEPKLDITAIDGAQVATLDFLIASEVFEHVAPPVQVAFVNARRLLRDDGVFIMTVPYLHRIAETIEHFPELHDFEIINDGGEPRLRNRRRDGTVEVFDELCFHGGPGETLEMRVFAWKSLLGHLQDAGFRDIEVCKDPMLQYGIYWSCEYSLPIVARC